MWQYFVLVILGVSFSEQAEIPEYIKQCRRSDSQLIDCLKGSLHHLKPYLATGIPDIKMPSVEPFLMDSLSLQLTGGPQGYRVNLKNMEIYGASNFTVKTIKLAEDNKPFEAKVTIPRLTIKARYTSSGVLLIIPASGAGDFDAVLDGITAEVKGQMSTNEKPTGTHLHVDSLIMDLNVKKVRMHIARVFKNNRILTEATNLFLRENGLEVLRAMQPQLQKKLAVEFSGIANQLLDNVPMESFIID